MKQAIIFLIACVISVKSELNWTPIGSPLITAFPCESRDIVTWFDPSLPPREKNRYYVYIHKRIPENSRIRLLLDSEAVITINFRTGYKKFVPFSFRKAEHLLLRFFKEMHGIGFIVKGEVPGTIPYIKSITLNYKELCNRAHSNYLEYYIAETLNSGPQENCGVPKVTRIKNSNSTIYKGVWPWHTALYRFDGSESKYICGGTLISKNFVLTAAHCASLRGVALVPEVLTVILGKFNLGKNEIGSQAKEIRRIILHEGFEYRHLYHDIALLKLKSEAIFNKHVQPACLWYSKAVDKLPNDQIIGTVVGWGLNGTANLKKRLQKIEMPFVSETDCVLSNSQAYSDLVVDSSKFCAGYRNGTSACNGDSGSAFQVLVDGAWYVRGIVSLTASQPNIPICDPTQYVVFTDIESYRVWIDAYLDNEDY